VREVSHSMTEQKWVCLLTVCIAGCGTGNGTPGGRVESRVDAQGGHIEQDSRCARDTGIIHLSQDSLGPLPAGASIANLRALCPASRDTIEYGHESANPAVVFPFWNLSVVAFQSGSVLHPSRPPDAWVVRGTNAMLPQGISLTATWKELQAAYGPAIGDDEFDVTVIFCKLPTFLFTMDAPNAVVEPGIEIRDSSVIPGDARIIDVMIVRSPLAGWHCR
jgi:hypothetical protein